MILRSLRIVATPYVYTQIGAYGALFGHVTVWVVVKVSMCIQIDFLSLCCRIYVYVYMHTYTYVCVVVKVSMCMYIYTARYCRMRA